MTFGGFILGALLFALGVVIVWKTTWFVENWGDLGEIVGLSNAQWASWKVLGIILIFVGFLIAFGLLQAFFWSTVGGLFSFGSLEPR